MSRGVLRINGDKKKLFCRLFSKYAKLYSINQSISSLKILMGPLIKHGTNSGLDFLAFVKFLRFFRERIQQAKLRKNNFQIAQVQKKIGSD